MGGSDDPDWSVVYACLRWDPREKESKRVPKRVKDRKSPPAKRHYGGFIFDEHGNRRDYSSEPGIPRVRILPKSERGK